MKRIALISDIHANIPALLTVFEKIDELGVDKIICLGDIVDYYPFPNKTTELVREKCDIVVQGNHDFAIASNPTHIETFNDLAKKSAYWTMSVLRKENKEWLAQLPLNVETEIEGKKFHFVHGHPRNPFEYIKGTPIEVQEKIKKAMYYTKADFLCVGHTHVPTYREIGGRYFINAGSVGQPRDKTPLASFIVMELPKSEIKIHSVEYDVEWVIEETKLAGLPVEMAERLRHGV